MDLTNLETPTANVLYLRLITAIDQALLNKDLKTINSIFKIISKYKPGPELIALNRLRSKGYITRMYLMRDSLSKSRKMYEMSGYIPTEAEKNDPRWKMALSVDVNPYTMKRNAKKFGWKIKRDGTPPLMR